MIDIHPINICLAHLTSRACMKKILLKTIAVLTFISASAFAVAQPSKQIQVLIGFPPGGPNDSSGRAVAEYINTKSSYQATVFNKTGAFGQLALKSAIDDKNNSVVMASSSSFVFNRVMLDKLIVEPLQDFTIIGPMLHSPLAVFTTKNSQVTKLTDFKNINKLNCGVSNQAAMLASKVLFNELQISVEVIQYKGSAQLLQGILSGEIECGVDVLATFGQYHNSGMMRIVAISGDSKLPNFESVPLMKETIKDKKHYRLTHYSSWFALMVPNRLKHSDFETSILPLLYQINQDSEFVNRVQKMGFYVSTPTKNFEKTLQDEFEYWESVRKQFQIEKSN